MFQLLVLILFPVLSFAQVGSVNTWSGCYSTESTNESKEPFQIKLEVESQPSGAVVVSALTMYESATISIDFEPSFAVDFMTGVLRFMARSGADESFNDNFQFFNASWSGVFSTVMQLNMIWDDHEAKTSRNPKLVRINPLTSPSSWCPIKCSRIVSGCKACTAYRTTNCEWCKSALKSGQPYCDNVNSGCLSKQLPSECNQLSDTNTTSTVRPDIVTLPPDSVPSPQPTPTTTSTHLAPQTNQPLETNPTTESTTLIDTSTSLNTPAFDTTHPLSSSPSAQTSSSSSSMFALIGGIGGGVCCLLIVTIVAIMLLRRSNDDNDNGNDVALHNNDNGYITPPNPEQIYDHSRPSQSSYSAGPPSISNDYDLVGPPAQIYH